MIFLFIKVIVIVIIFLVINLLLLRRMISRLIGKIEVLIKLVKLVIDFGIEVEICMYVK